MKKLLMLILITAFALPAFARTTNIIGHGRESGLCSASPLDVSCIREVKDRAEKDALRDADWSCQSSRGHSYQGTGNCNSSCFPNYIPPNTGPTVVRCTATCTLKCKI